MTDKEYTNNDIINLIGRNDDYYRSSLAILETKAEKTEAHLDKLNGSVGRIDRKQIWWSGVSAATGVIVLAVLAIGGWVLIQEYNLNGSVAALKSALNIYTKQSH